VQRDGQAIQRERIEEQKRYAADREADRRAKEAELKDSRLSRTQSEGWRVEDRMKGDYEQATKTHREAADAASKLRKLAEVPSTQNRKLNANEQQTLIFLFGKVVDPTSVLREGEYDRIAATRGITDTLGMLMDKATSGAILTPKQVAAIGDIASFYERESMSVIRDQTKSYEEIARRRGVDPSAIITNPAYRTQSVPAIPQGAVRERPSIQQQPSTQSGPPPGAVRLKAQ
jgi:hypothetical protein